MKSYSITTKHCFFSIFSPTKIVLEQVYKCRNSVFAPSAGEKWNSSNRSGKVLRIHFVSTCFASFDLWELLYSSNSRPYFQPSSHALAASQGPLSDDPYRRHPNGTGQTEVPPHHPLFPDLSPGRGAVSVQVWIVLGRDPQNSRAQDCWRALVRAPGGSSSSEQPIRAARFRHSAHMFQTGVGDGGLKAIWQLT